MRLMILASLAFAPALVSAQTPKMVAMNSAAIAAAAAEAPRPISTGVIAPRLLRSAAVESSTLGHPSHVTVSLVVDAEGKPTNVKVASLTDERLADSVAHSVAQFRYAPGTLNGRPAAVPVTLELTIVPTAN